MRVAVYARVSTTRQAQAQGIEQQLDRLRAAVAERGWELDGQHVYRDDGFSGARFGRPGLDRLPGSRGAGRAGRRRGGRAGPAGPQLRPSGAADRRAGRPWLPGRVLGPADDAQTRTTSCCCRSAGRSRSMSGTLIAERMRRGRQARLRAGTLLPWTTPPFGVPAGSRPAAPGICGAGGPRGGGTGGAAVRLVPGTAGHRLPARPAADRSGGGHPQGRAALEHRQRARHLAQPGLCRPGAVQPHPGRRRPAAASRRCSRPGRASAMPRGRRKTGSPSRSRRSSRRRPSPRCRPSWTPTSRPQRATPGTSTCCAR